MLPKIQHNLTNWIDGMKISRKHFINSENALVDLLRDASAFTLNTYNYGLLAPPPGEKSSLECNVFFAQSNKFKISVSLCRAVTYGGCRIEILPGLQPELVSDNEIFAAISGYDSKSKNNTTSYLAIISVDPFNRVPFGIPLAEEFPPRNPYSTAAYKLNLVPEDTLDTSDMGAFHIPIARFRTKNDELVRDTNYIPPCAVISAHPGTKQIYNVFAEALNKIQEYCTQAVQKIVGTGQNSSLAVNIRNICEKNIWHISSEYFVFRMMYREQSPIYIANCVIKLANILNISLSIIPDKEKEELLQYFNYWNEISPGKFQEMLSAVIDADYEHENIYDFFQPLLNFIKIWCDLLEKLKDLKIMGQKDKKFDFGGRTVETSKTKEKGKFEMF